LLPNLLTKLPSLATAMSKVGGLTGGVSQELMGFIGFATNAATGVAMGSSLLDGQEVGGVLDFADGCIDLGEEKYHANGGDESGTFAAACGNLASGAAVGAFSLLHGTGKLTKMPLLKGKLGLLNKVAQGLFVWQGATLVDEVWNGDGDVYKDKFDIVGNVVSLLSLAMLFKGGKAAKLFAKKKPGGGGNAGSRFSRPKNRPPSSDSARRRLATVSQSATNYNLAKNRSLAHSAFSSSA
jgi:hypothetical protein